MYPTTRLGRTFAVLSLVIALILLGCDDPTRLVSPDAELRMDRRTQYTLNVSPGNQTSFIGDTVFYTVSVTDQRGRPVAPSAATWSVGSSSLARVLSGGRVMALAAGSTTVQVSTYGLTRSVPLTIQVRAQTPGTPAPAPAPAPAPPPSGSSEPMFVAGTHTSLWHDDFESTTSTAGIYARYATQSSENGLHLDASGGLNGSRGMRIDWQARSGCNDDSHFIEASITPSQEVVVQYSVRYQAQFVYDWIGRGGACSGNAKKLFFLWAGAGSRFDFISENHAIGVGSDHDHPLFAQSGTPVTPEALGNGQWHRITLRIRQSSTPTATDGYIHGWIDGVQKWNVNNIASQASGGWVLFKLPTTFNQGSPVNQSEWMDNFRIWRP